MNTIYKTVKEKTNVRGFWKDDKKIYIDNIKLVDYSENEKQKLFLSGELAVFYADNSTAYIESKDGNIQTLRTKLVFHDKRISKALVKALLAKHGGFTVYRNKTFNDYTFEIWS